MKVSMTAVGVAAAALLVGGVVAGCGDEKSSTPSSASSSAASSSAAPSSSGAPAQPKDYTGLLIPATDIQVPGDTFQLTQKTPITTPAGIEGVYNNQTNSRKVEISIYMYGSPDEAKQALETTSKSIQELSVKAPSSPADVGTAGVIATGPSPDGAKAKGVVMFTEGKSVTIIELESAPDDPVDQGFLLDLAKKQDAAVKAGLPA